MVQQYLASEDPNQSEALLKEIQDKKGGDGRADRAGDSKRHLSAGTEGRSACIWSLKLKGEPADYALYVPESYDPATAYPLIVCLHGAGFTGDSYLERWQARLGEKTVLACPTMMGGAWWTPKGRRW
ncbi:MAG: hypothetical protein MPW15_04250 [Candidatus Manganitrophus sp.]|nr:hypothetical protein [Candidatus Manganitrophus sp.]